MDTYLKLITSDMLEWNVWRIKENHTFLNMESVDLSHRWFVGYDLRFINFSKANLSYAQLTGANLTGCDFTDANLSRSHLREAFLASTLFERTNLTGAHFDLTRFLYKNFSECIGLDLCDHQDDSVMDLWTLYHSPNLPLEFRDGVGLL